MRKQSPRTAPLSSPLGPWISPQDTDGPGEERVGRESRPKSKAQQPAKPKDAKRFIEPFAYTDEQRAAIARVLASHGLGDEMSRDIFIGAIAYDLAVLDDALRQSIMDPEAPSSQASAREQSKQASSRPAVAQPSSPSDSVAPDLAATDLTEKADALRAALAALDADHRNKLLEAVAAQDRFRREYTGAYLDALTTELERISAAANNPRQPSRQAPVQPGSVRDRRAGAGRTSPPDKGAPAKGTAATDQAAAAFIRHAASVYEQCFETAPGPEQDGPFAFALRAVANETGVAIPVDTLQLGQDVAPR